MQTWHEPRQAIETSSSQFVRSLLLGWHKTSKSQLIKYRIIRHIAYYIPISYANYITTSIVQEKCVLKLAAYPAMCSSWIFDVCLVLQGKQCGSFHK